MARIVVVEDDGALRHDMAYHLTKWGHEVIQAADAARGYDAVVRWNPDIVLSDICMPSESGFDLAKRVRDRGLQYSNLAFIFISSLSDSTDVIYGMHCGADDYITKPLNYASLKAKVERNLKRKNNFLAMLVRRLTSIGEPEVKRAFS